MYLRHEDNSQGMEKQNNRLKNTVPGTLNMYTTGSMREVVFLDILSPFSSSLLIMMYVNTSVSSPHYWDQQGTSKLLDPCARLYFWTSSHLSHQASSLLIIDVHQHNSFISSLLGSTRDSNWYQATSSQSVGSLITIIPTRLDNLLKCTPPA